MSDRRFPPSPQDLHEGVRVYVPGPANVSEPGRSMPRGAPVGNMGPQYGTQQSATWDVGDGTPRQLCDVTKAAALWRLSVFGAVRVTIAYGTSKNRDIVRLLAPVVITLPGQFTVTAEPTNTGVGATAVVTLTQATAGALSQARKFVAGGPVALDDGAVRFVALAAASLTISGVVVAVPTLSTVPLVAGSVLTSGSGFMEFEA